MSHGTAQYRDSYQLSSYMLCNTLNFSAHPFAIVLHAHVPQKRSFLTAPLLRCHCIQRYLYLLREALQRSQSSIAQFCLHDTLACHVAAPLVYTSTQLANRLQCTHHAKGVEDTLCTLALPSRLWKH